MYSKTWLAKVVKYALDMVSNKHAHKPSNMLKAHSETKMLSNKPTSNH